MIKQTLGKPVWPVALSRSRHSVIVEMGRREHNLYLAPPQILNTYRRPGSGQSIAQ